MTRIVTSQKNEGIYVTGCHRVLVETIANVKYLVIVVSSVVGLIALLVTGMGIYVWVVGRRVGGWGVLYVEPKKKLCPKFEFLAHIYTHTRYEMGCSTCL